ncbi:MAG: polysaccharide deacetylase family protein [Candidatus Neomarinimicrobiota bacterium]
MRLTVGVTTVLPQWELLLGQIGLPMERVVSDQAIPPDRYAVIIVTQGGGPSEKESLLHYVKQGGSLLTEADAAHWLFGIRTIQGYVSYVATAGDPIFDAVLPGFVDASVRIPHSASHLQSDSGRKLVRVLHEGRGSVIILPSLLSSTVLDSKVRRRNFPSRGPLLPSERVSRRSKQTIRETIQGSLEYLYMKRGLPFVSLWPFPDGARTLFNFRIDTDFASRENVNNLYELCDKREVPATWFLEVHSSRKWLARFGEMENQEMGVHCYRHRIFPDFVRNERDINRAVRMLNDLRIRPSGYAAPFGEWNVPLAKALEHHGFYYSSEFCLDYDNLPFNPYLGDRFTSVLQVPIHPIATSRLRNAHHSPEDMKIYFEDLIQTCIIHHLPVFVYDHPSNADLKTVNWLFSTIRRRQLSRVSLAEYARWWKKRSNLKWTADWDSGNLTVECPFPDSSICLYLRNSTTKWATVKIKDEIDLDTVAWKKDKKAKTVRTPMRNLASWNRKMTMNDILHFYWKLRY